MPKFRVKDGRLVGDDGLPMLNQEERARPLQMPRVFGDLPGYTSPIDGKYVEGRRARRYDLERSGCIDANELKSPTGGKLRNERFAKKHGLEHLLER